MSETDTRFFTNTTNNSLLERFQKTLTGAEFFDVLVGYFRSSGFNNLYKSLTDVKKIRILVGLNTDAGVVSAIETAKNGTLFQHTSQEIKDNCRHYVKKDYEESPDTKDTLDAATTFIKSIKDGKLEIRAYPDQNIHAKVYITRFPLNDRDYGRVITGSSNFSENGLKANQEFNVELKDKADVEFALARFEDLWKQGTDVTYEYVDAIEKETWINPNITPYELYLKLLYEYFKEDINLDKEPDFRLPDGYMELEYQKQAVVAAKKILNAYNGVFLSDVVGLGKTYITALLLQQFPTDRKLILCPPVLQETWKNAMVDFRITGVDVESTGKLEKVEKRQQSYDIIVIDEAHRFRNEITFGYESLHNICAGKKVILVSATPINNKYNDLLNLIKLFQSPRQSDIPGVANLEAFFATQNKKLNNFTKGSKEYLKEVANTSAEIRNKVLSHLMVRRTRSEIKANFESDIKNRGLKFPELANPKSIIYVFDDDIESAFNQTISLLKPFSYSRYTPLLFLKEKPIQRIQQQQKNMGGFMKSILVKRLESSFYAFKKTIDRFVESYQKFINMFDAGEVYISKKVDVYTLLEEDRVNELLRLVEQEKAEKYLSSEFDSKYREKLQHDLDLLLQIKEIWRPIEKEPKLDKFAKIIHTDANLKGHKLIVFTEAKETSDIIYKRLNKEFNGRVLRYSSEGADFQDKKLSPEDSRHTIKANFDPNNPDLKNDIDILITTDVLAEGVNLHHANVLINYDLPFNPTKILQRVGRVNRVGTKHTTIYLYNCFPTTKANEHIHLTETIISKIQAFHKVLGSDAKYLSEDEEIESYGLYEKLTNKEYLEAEDENEESELQYLNVIRKIRDNDPSLFERIKRLPKKARTATNGRENDVLVSFFRKGALKKFIASSSTKGTKEIIFMEAAKLFECSPSQYKRQIPEIFYDFLHKNKTFLREQSENETKEIALRRRGNSNEANIQTLVKFLLKDTSCFTDNDEEYLQKLNNALTLGNIAKNTLKVANKALKTISNNDKLKILGKLKEYFSEKNLGSNKTPVAKNINSNQEIILSEYFYGEK